LERASGGEGKCVAELTGISFAARIDQSRSASPAAAPEKQIFPDFAYAPQREALRERRSRQDGFQPPLMLAAPVQEFLAASMRLALFSLHAVHDKVQRVVVFNSNIGVHAVRGREAPLFCELDAFSEALHIRFFRGLRSEAYRRIRQSNGEQGRHRGNSGTH
jgi:hypothetical protein